MSAESISSQLQIDRGDDNDSDSTLGNDRYTITTSLAASVTDYRHENGRRYHSFQEDAYFLPNDEDEAARLDLQHHTWKLTFDGGFGRIPLDERIKTVLDVGTGTGIWAVELAEAFPHMQVYGTDLSPIQPDFVPPNCHFIVDNAELDWAFDYKFDYIHARMLTMGMHDWPRFFEQCWNHLEPGGWIETLEVQFPAARIKGEETQKSAFVKWGEYCYEAAQRAGIDARASEKFTGQLQSRGFVNVDRVDVQWPIRPWAKGRKAKVMGRLLYENTKQAVPAVCLALFTRQLGWTKEEADAHVAEALRDVDDKNNHYYWPMTLHRAQKPA